MHLLLTFRRVRVCGCRDVSGCSLRRMKNFTTSSITTRLEASPMQIAPLGEVERGRSDYPLQESDARDCDASAIRAIP